MAIFSRLSLKFLETLVYMLQAVEYHVDEYFSWLWRTSDFSKVAIRKQIVWTLKAKLIWFSLWILVVLWFVFAVFLARIFVGFWFQVMVIGLAILILPFVLPYLIVLPLYIFKFTIQKMVEYLIIRKAKAKLQTIKAVKIAIAGSYGKSTFKEILVTILAEGKKVKATTGNQNTPLGISRFIAGLPGAEEVLIFEMGEYYPGDIKILCDIIQPDLGVITGINEAHLSRFKKIENSINTIFELADYLGNKPLYVNIESRYIKNKILPNHIRYNKDGVGKWVVVERATGLGGTSFRLKNAGVEIMVRSKLLGKHQVGPLATAVVIARHLGLAVQDIEKGVENTRPFEHRLQLQVWPGGVTVIDDTYNGNPEGVRAGLDFLKEIKGHRLIYLTPGLVEMGHQAKEIHLDIGRRLVGAVEMVILIKNSVTPYIATGLTEAGFKGSVVWYESMPKALVGLKSLTLSGDLVLMQNDWPDQYK
ncbi:MAG: UDP-N-acetylmuramoyl-tripeptide--D-alanyl-D-alanine ligase [Patescibacteria group bacterium]